jgi:hypothetical protein
MHTGDDRDLSVTVYTTHTGTTPKDLTGATATYSVRDKPGGTLLFTPKTVGAGISNTNFATGIVYISIDSADTIDSKVSGGYRQDFYHELEVVLSGEVATAMKGRFRLNKSVSGAGAA